MSKAHPKTCEYCATELSMFEIDNTAYDAATAQLETWQTEQAELDNQIIALLRQAKKG